MKSISREIVHNLKHHITTLNSAVNLGSDDGNDKETMNEITEEVKKALEGFNTLWKKVEEHHQGKENGK